MKAYLISEILSFDRFSNNPLDKLKIGKIENRSIENFIKDVENIGINIKKEKSVSTEGVWDFELKDKEYPEISYDEYYIFYTPKKIAEREKWGDEYGFFLSDEKDGSILIGPTDDWKELVIFLKNERNKFISKLHESLNFERSKNNPLDKLNIGRIDERNIQNFVKNLNKIGIKAKSSTYGVEGAWIFSLKDIKTGYDWDRRFNIIYLSEKAAKEEGLGDDWGFMINKTNINNEIEYIFYSKDNREVISFILKLKNKIYR